MKVNLECIPCFQKQALRAVRFISDDEGVQEQVLREVMDTLLGLEWGSTPPEMAHEVHRIVRNLTPGKDPYAGVKRESNQLVMEMYPELKNRVEESEDPLRTAIRLAIAGNIIDYGAVEEFDLEGTVEEVLNQDFAVDHYQQFTEALEEADTLLFFTDNAGEIVFDKLLLETLLDKKQFEKVRIVVKGGPIINDATLQDAVYVGIDQLPNVEFWTLSNGEEDTGPERTSSQVKEWIEKHDLVISKGQGNYEGLSERRGLFFMLMVKCPIIARHLGVKVRDIILRYNP
ncbi:MAG: damage-control phosphatase ARMT1 family protein [Thermoproteota archaeon]